MNQLTPQQRAVEAVVDTVGDVEGPPRLTATKTKLTLYQVLLPLPEDYY